MKANNQYYGRAFEEAIVALINKEETDFDFYDFPAEDLDNILTYAQNSLKYFEKGVAIYNGRNINGTGDIIINNKSYEVKLVSGGKGTYFNTTMRLLDDFLPFTYLPYMEKEGIFDSYEKKGIQYHRDVSPIKSTKQASELRHSNPSFAEEVGELDKHARAKYIKDAYDYFSAHKESLYKLVSTLITKNNCSGKTIPDYYLVYNYTEDKIIFLTKEDILNNLTIKDFSCSKLGFVFKNIRIAIGYQNGNGICNPILRVFLK